jgi:hypothetical protein
MRGDKPRQPGVYVPPPQKKRRPIDERIAKLKARSTTPDFLDAAKPEESVDSLARGWVQAARIGSAGRPSM